jgi:repressor LexA
LDIKIREGMKLMDLVSTFGKRLSEFRTEKDLTLEELGNVTDIPPQTLNRYELGHRTPKVDTASDIAVAIGVNPLWLNGFNVPEYQSLRPIVRKSIPMLGSIACGTPIWAEERFEGYVDANADIHADYCVTAVGDSMVNARILHGDVVFIEETTSVENGQIAVVLINDEVTLKRFYKEGDVVTLVADNPAYRPMVFVGEQLRGMRILGRAVAFQSSIR